MNDGVEAQFCGYALTHLRKRRIEENGKVCNFQPFTINFLLFATDVDVVVIFVCTHTTFYISDFCMSQKKAREIKYQRK